MPGCLCLCLTLADGLTWEIAESGVPCGLTLSEGVIGFSFGLWLRLRDCLRFWESTAAARLAWETAVGVGLWLRNGLCNGLWSSATTAWLAREAAVRIRDSSAVGGHAEDGGNDGDGELHDDSGGNE